MRVISSGPYGQTMVPDLDIYRSAKRLIKQHGDEAPIFAAMRVDAMAEAGDEEGHQVWRRISKAIDELQAKEPPVGAAVH